MKTKAIVIQDEDKEKFVERPVLAKAIIKISQGFDALRKSGLNERAIVLLIADCTSVGKPDIRAVLSALSELESTYTQ